MTSGASAMTPPDFGDTTTGVPFPLSRARPQTSKTQGPFDYESTQTEKQVLVLMSEALGLQSNKKCPRKV